MRVIDYPKVDNLNQDDIFLIDGSRGTKTILSKNMMGSLVKTIPSSDYIDDIKLNDQVLVQRTIDNGDSSDQKVMKYAISEDTFTQIANVTPYHLGYRRNIYRGKNLGSSVTPEQWETIRTGAFDNLFIGDYWDIDGVKWNIVDFNYFLNVWSETNKTWLRTPHVVIMPNGRIGGNAKMNDTDTNSGGYVSAAIRSYLNGDVKTAIYNIFGSGHILKVPRNFSNGANTSGVTGMIAVDSEVDLPSTGMITGTSYQAYSSSFIGNAETQQFALCRLYQNFTYLTGLSCWTCDVGINNRFFAIDGGGPLSISGRLAYQQNGVRPVFSIYQS